MPELKIEKQNENVLLHRKEVHYRIIFAGEATPSREKIREIIAKNTGAPKELVIVDRNIQETGKNEVVGYSKIYSSKEDAMLFEPDYELFRNGLKRKEAATQ